MDWDAEWKWGRKGCPPQGRVLSKGWGSREEAAFPDTYFRTLVFCVKCVYCCTNPHMTKQAKYRRMYEVSDCVSK